MKRLTLLSFVLTAVIIGGCTEDYKSLCQENEVACGNACIVPNGVENCGACGNACPTHAQCVQIENQYLCQCEAGYSSVSNICVDPCDVLQCDPDETCVAGKCKKACDKTWDADCDGTPDILDVCPNDPNKTASAGECGCGNTDNDSDRDGTPDCNDACPNDRKKTESAGECGCNALDSDEDGLDDCVDACPDKKECPIVQCLGIMPNESPMDTSKDSVNCPLFQNQYIQTKADEGLLLPDDKLDAMLQTGANYAMGMSFNHIGFKKLLDAAVDWKSFKPEIDFGGCRKYATDANYIDGLTVDNCVAFGFTVSAMGYNVSAIFGVPIVAEVKPADSTHDERTSVFADLPRSQILKIKANNSSTLPAVLDLLSTAVQSALKAGLGDSWRRICMFDIAPWEIGNKEVKLYAGAPKIHYDTTTGYQAIEFGMYSNLVSSSESVNIARTSPQDAEIGLHMHPDLIRAIIGRMMTEQDSTKNDSYITRDITAEETGNNGSFHVTLAPHNLYPKTMLNQCTAEWLDDFAFGFRLWSTESFCGFVDVLPEMGMDIRDQQLKVGVKTLQIGASDGPVNISNQIDALTNTDFFKEMLNYTSFSLNFNELTVTDKDTSVVRKAPMEPVRFSLSVDGAGISMYLNFLDL